MEHFGTGVQVENHTKATRRVPGLAGHSCRKASMGLILSCHHDEPYDPMKARYACDSEDGIFEDD